MSHGTIVVSGCLLHIGLSSDEIAVYLVIKSHDWGKTPWTLTNEQVANEAGISRRTAQRVLAELVSLKAIKRVPGELGSPNAWQVLDPPKCKKCGGKGRPR